MLAAAALAGTAALGLPAPAWLAALALIPSLTLLPGALLARHVWPRRGPAARLLLALSLSPLLTGGAAAVLLGAGLRIGDAARLLLGGLAVWALIEAFRRAPEDTEREGRALWVPAVSWAAILATYFGLNPALASHFDGWFHAAVVLQVVERGLPLEDPMFAGLRLLYFWGYHVWAALWLGAAPRLAVWTPLVVLTISGGLATMLGLGLLARRLGAGRTGVWATAALAVFGYSPFSWVWWIVTSFTGHQAGIDQLLRAFSGGVGPFYSALNFPSLHASMVFFGDKFLLPTPFALGLGLFTAWLLAFLDLVERPGARAALALFLIQCAAWFLHSVVGWSTALLAGAWWWWALWRARLRGERTLDRMLVILPWVIVAAGLVLAPYLLTTTVGKRETLSWGLSRAALVTWLVAGALLVLPGFDWLVRHARASGAARELCGLTGILTVISLCVALPNNQSKFFNLLFLLLTPPAALGWLEFHSRLRGRGRALLVRALAIGALPGTLLCFWGQATERRAYAPDWQRPASTAEAEAWTWAESHTPRDAVFVDPSQALHSPVLARRSVLFAGDVWGTLWGYPEHALELRRESARVLGSGETPSTRLATFLRDLHRPLLVVVRGPRVARDGSGAEPISATPSRLSASGDAAPPGYALVYRNDEVSFFSWEPGP
jgi:hypothetical protein